MRAALLLVLVLLLLAPASFAIKPLENFEDYPGFGFLVFQTPEQWQANLDSVIMSFSNDSVTGHSALKLAFPSVPGIPGRIVRANTFANFEGAKAISFWLKGDGSRGYGIVSLAQKVDAPKARFYLRDKRWRRVVIPWNRFQPWAGSVPLLAFGLSPDSPRPCSYIIDKIEAVESTALIAEDTRLADAANKATFSPDPALPNVFDRYFAYTNYLATARLDLKSRKPLTVLVLGDLVARGDKLYNVDADDSVQALHRYPAILGRLLAEKYGYDTHPIVSENFRGRTAREVVNFGALRIVNLSKDGRASEAPARLKRFLDESKPSLVVIQLGSADSLAASTVATTKALTDCIDMLRADKINCMLLTNVPGYLRTTDEEPFARDMRLLARDQHVALVDLRKLFMSFPNNAWSVYFSDRYVPNTAGHLVIAQMIAAAFD
jgi:hypothetical protein